MKFRMKGGNKMKIRLNWIIPIIAVALLTFSTFAAASMIIPANDNAKENSRAPEKSPVIGDNWDLERVDFIHYAKSTSPARPGKTSTCYKLMGYKWNSLPVKYYINPSNPQGLTEDFVMWTIYNSAETWDAATSKELFENSINIDYSATYGIQDYKNSIAFGAYPDNGVIAVTSVWFTRIGKQIVEFDQLYNTYYSWGNADNGWVEMDLQNIATHELGHAVGLDDIYTTSCDTVTMYGYADWNDISKRTLESADVTGLRSMYGA